MTLTGPQVLSALEEALRAICAEEAEILHRLSRKAERIAKFRESEGEQLRLFSASRLPEATVATLADTLSAAAARARETLAERTRIIAEAETRLRRLAATLARLEAERAAALADAGEQQAALRTLAPRIAAAVGRDPEYDAQRAAAAMRKAIAAEAKAKARLADLDRELKGRPYRTDPLFGYLRERGFGTPDYKGRGLVARLDGWVARLTGFARAQENYTLLNALPGRLHAHAAAQQGLAEAAEAQVDALEVRAIVAAGGGPLQAAFEAARERIVEADRAIAATSAERDEVTGTATRLAGVADADLTAAMRKLAGALGAEDVPSLIVAELHGGKRGGALLVQLDDAHRRTSEAELDGLEDMARLEVLATRRRHLEAVIARVKAGHFDDPRAVFADDAIATEQLDGFLDGTLSTEDYQAALERSHGWIAGTSDWGGGVGLPRRGRGGSSAAAPDGAGTVPPQQAVEDA